jgi:Tol biopolymer transport system component
MTAEQWQSALRIYSSARERPAEEWRAFVESESPDPEIVQEALDLLKSASEPDSAPRSRAVPTARSGGQIGRYEIGPLLGRGGMGEVYAGRDTDLDRPVALKFFLADTLGDQAIRRFVREARAASGLNHPNILTVYEVVRSESSLAIAMELVVGKRLSQFRGEPLPCEQVVDFGRQIASALAAAHEHGIVHRDIKPENLMLRGDGLVKVLDFGLAREVAAPPAEQTQTTDFGAVAGTPRYMSPEQLRGEPVTGASDVFSLGVVMYELATGRRPFEAQYAWEAAYAIVAVQPTPPASVNPSIPRALEALILAMLAKDPAARPPSRYLAVAAIVLAVGAGVYGIRVEMAALPAAVQPRPPVPLTGMDGLELWPAFSPDGKQIVYTRDIGDGKPDLYLKLIGGGPPLRLRAIGSGNLDPAWSPDGLQIAFRREYPDHVGVFIMSALGGAERLVRNVSDPVRTERGLAWRPDGKALIVSDRVRAGTSALWSLPLDGSARQRLTSPPDDYLDVAPAFSSDGKTLAFIRSTGTDDELFLMRRQGKERRIPTGRSMDSLAWSADGQSIFFTTRDVHDRAIFRIRPGGGDAVRLSRVAAASPFNLTVAGQGDRLAFAQRVPGTSEILKLDITGKTAPRKLIASGGFDTDPSFSPDGTRIAFASTRSGNSQIWVAAGDGSNPVPVTSYDGPQSGSPRWSPDGKQLAFDHDLKVSSGVFVMSVDGGAARKLASNAALPEWSPDGRWIYFRFRPDRSGSWQIWKAPSTGGTPVQLTENGGFECFPSPDGRFLYYTKDRERAGIWRMPVDGGQETEVPELRPVLRYRYWSGTSAGIYFLDPGTGGTFVALKFFRFANRRLEPVLSSVPLPMSYVRGLAVSPDGRQILWVQLSRRISQILLVEGFR